MKILVVAAALLVSSALANQAFHPITAKIDGATESIYTARVIHLVQSWPESDFPKLTAQDRPFWIEGIRTAGNSSYIGLRKRVFIQAPVDRVLSVLEDFADYPSVFPGVEQVKIPFRDGNEVTTDWVRERPIFLAPKVRYEQTYVSQKIGDRTFLRYQLRSGNSMSHCDGVIVVEPATGGTYVSSYDYFEGKFGIAKLIAEKKIWEKTFQGYAQADFALKFKSENPGWTREQIASKIESNFDANPLKLGAVRFLASVPRQ